MPSKSEQQRKYIFAMRGKYGSKDKAPEDMKWVFNPEWEKVEENEFQSDYEDKIKYEYEPDEDEFRTPQGQNMRYESKVKTYKRIFK